MIDKNGSLFLRACIFLWRATVIYDTGLIIPELVVIFEGTLEGGSFVPVAVPVKDGADTSRKGVLAFTGLTVS